MQGTATIRVFLKTNEIVGLRCPDFITFCKALVMWTVALVQD